MFFRKRAALESTIALIVLVLTLLVSRSHTISTGVALAATAPATEVPVAPVVQGTEDPLVVTGVPTSSATEDPSLAARDVMLKLDDAHGVSQVMQYEGGLMTTTGADGTKYTLTFAKGTVLVPTQITMTPIASVTSQSGQTFPALGVQLGPNGLGLYMPADLLIEPAQPIPVDQQLSFSFEGNGQGAYRYPLDKDPHKILFHLYHFSGGGLISAVSDAMKDLFSSTLSGASNEAQIHEQQAQIIDDWRKGNLSDGEASDKILKTLEAWQKEIVDPKVDILAKNANPTEADVAAVAVPLLGLMREWALFNGGKDPLNDPQFARDMDVLLKAVKKVVDTAIKNCGKGPHKLFYEQLQDAWYISVDGVRRVLSDVREAMLMGVIDDKGNVEDFLKYCKPAGFKYSGLILTQTASQNGGTVQLDITLGGRVCSPDPFAKGWTPVGLKQTTTTTLGGVSSTRSGEIPTRGLLELTRDAPTTIRAITVQLIPGNPTLMRASASAPGYTKAGPVDTTVEEDDTCPAPK